MHVLEQESIYGRYINFHAKPEWKATLERFGVTVRLVAGPDGSKLYRLTRAGGDIRALFPGTAFEQDGPDAILLHAEGLLYTMEFLHQSSRTALAQAIERDAAPNPRAPATLGQVLRSPVQSAERAILDAEARKANKADAHSLRDLKEREMTLARRMLRFAVTGSTFLPPLNVSEKESEDCHAVIEAGMRYDQKLLKKPEFADPENSPGAIPHTAAAAESFITLAVDSAVSGLEDNIGDEAKLLRDSFWALVNDATNERYPVPQPQITLTARESHRLILAMHDAFADPGPDGLAAQIYEAGVEEQALARKESIEAEIDALKGSAYIARAMQYTVLEKNALQQLKRLMRASSALAPLMQNAQMQELWARYHYTEKLHGPLRDLAHEFAVMQKTMRYFAEGDVSPVTVEAITQEFYHLLHFALSVSGIIQAAGDRSQSKKRERKKAGSYLSSLDEYQRLVPALQAAIREASLSGDFAIADRFINDNHEKILDVLNRMAGRGGSPIVRGGTALGKSIYEFVGAMLTSAREHKALAVATLALGLWVSSNTMTMQRRMINTQPQALQIDEFGLPVVADVDKNKISSEYKSSNYGGHFHQLLWGLVVYKHTAQGGIVNSAQMILDVPRIAVHTPMGIAMRFEMDLKPNIANGFSRGVEAVVTPTADKLLIANYYQNILPHAMLWAFAIGLGGSVGFRGLKDVLRLMHDTVDLAALGGTKVMESLIVQLPSRALYNGLNNLGVDQYVLAHPLMAMIPLRHRYALAERVTLLTKEILCNPDALALLEAQQEDTAKAVRTIKLPVAMNGHGNPGAFHSESCQYANGVCAVPAATAAVLPPVGASFPRRPAPLPQALPSLCVDRTSSNGQGCLLRELDLTARIRTAAERALRPEILTIKTGGLRRSFNITTRSVDGMLESLARFDVVMAHIAGKIGVEEVWYRNLLLEKTRALRNALLMYANSQGLAGREQLRQVMEETLDDVIGAQMYVQGQSKIYQAVFGPDPAAARGRLRRFLNGRKTKYDKQRRALAEHGRAMFGRLNRADMRAGRAQATRDVGSPLSLTGHFSASASNLGSHVWGALLWAARTARDARRRIMPRPVLLGLLALDAGLIAANMAGFGARGGALDSFAFANGAAAGIGTTTGLFGIFNTVEDSIGIHGVIVGTNIITGAVVIYYGFGHFLRPLGTLAHEWLLQRGINLRKSWQESSSFVKSQAQGKAYAKLQSHVLQPAQQRMRHLNIAGGRLWTLAEVWAHQNAAVAGQKIVKAAHAARDLFSAPTPGRAYEMK